MSSFFLIDPPVSAWSTPAELRDWLEVLQGLERTPEVRSALAEARAWLVESERREGAGDGSDN